MALILPTFRYPLWLQELEVPKPFSFQTDQDLTGCSAVTKVRASENGAVLVTLTSPTDIYLGGDTGAFSLTFTGTHWTALYAVLGAAQGVYDTLITPPVGAPQVALAGPIGLGRTVSR